ncbi:SoxR reducing system RseC family protein [Spirochaeta isovalerica]|uniref:Positive regulator of sigma E activity n=1 Tax=Spirochaeta isovalerica TaxID=150 RepID=A0A841RE05_9SPIO|nr:SoxR reducing system RseC family protein [Spirochaeta isovalerica]MBB6482295.1 positive regulator of sigma E activity [Spirochaeta isovalerica]
MKKIAIIDRLESDALYATYIKSEHGGHHKAFIKIQEDLTFKVDNPSNLFLLKGDSVEIFIEPKNAIALTFSMFIQPLIAFIIFYTSSMLFFKGDSEFFRILTGITGILLSFAATYVFLKYRPQKLPVITKKVSQAEIAAACPAGTSCKSCSGCG